MKAKLIRMTEENLNIPALEEAGEILKNGGLVGFPTETVYGLGGNALDPEASRKIYAAKGRPSDNPLIIHIADLEALPPIVREIPEKARILAEACWPGPLTMIFPKADIVPYETTGGLDTVAVRLPSNEIAREMIRRAGGYVAAPSANVSGRPSPTTAEHVAEDLGERIEMIIDGGLVQIGLESTIVDCTEETPMILRPGFLNQEKLEEILGRVELDPGLLGETAHVRPKAPGMRYRHYAPKADLSIVEGDSEAVVSEIRRLSREYRQAGKKVGIICTDETRAHYTEGTVLSIGARAEEETIARHLYEVLRQFDETQVDVIFSESFHTPQMGMAIMNRLLKAAGHRVISAGSESEEKEWEQ
ncbi:MAG: L-threonylcarbamoyladenylate synthase [Lachnospiraceae bacterium]|nr:L-threonylcarbamoyladenylate synthase [Lachnospiraceae bacterium]